nr:chorion peroxidase [Onthophagus taurus]
MYFNLLLLLFIPLIDSFVHHKSVRRDLEKHHKLNNNFFTPTTHKIHVFTDHICAETNAICVHPVQCPAHFRLGNLKKCTLKGGTRGLCCSSGQNHTVHSIKRNRESFVKVSKEIFKDIHRSSRYGMEKLRGKNVELLSLKEPPKIMEGTPSFGHFRSKRVYDKDDVLMVMEVADKAMEVVLATKALKERQSILVDDFEWNIIGDNLHETPLRSSCIPQPKCPPILSPYRRFDGSCNTHHNPSWGSSLSPFSRLLPPKYHDGIWSPRRSILNQPLPSPRLISSTIFEDTPNPDHDHTLMVMQFGQFLSHDITHSLDFTFPNGSGISCCGEKDEYILPEIYQHHACLPIEVPHDDEFYSRFNVKCINFVRSMLSPRTDCSLGYTQQMNKVTHFIDASTVYGSSGDQALKLRTFEGGRLKSFEDFGRNLLPLSRHEEACLTMEKGSACFESGDSRTNQMITLVAVHTLFMREHNRIAGILEEINENWTDERIFLETRRILIAQLQVIVYKEFLPSVLGEIAMEEFGLNLEDDGFYSDDYDEGVEPSITNEFAAAAYRFGHSIVGGTLSLYSKIKMEEVVSIPEVMFYPARMRKYEFLDEILSSLTTEPIEKADGFLSDALTKYMFKAGNPFGVDLASLNIQRGRDHGLRPYNDYRILVGLEPIKSFIEFGSELGEKLSKVYASPDDIDLWVGGLLEGKVPGSILGLTFRDIIADQFSRLKKGDRYFFENNPKVNPGHFNLDQLRELKQASMSRIICDNSDRVYLTKQALNAFKKPGVIGNEFKECDSNEIPRVNLMFWKEF